MTPSSWREQQKTFFAEKNIEFEQDQRIIDWLDNTKTYVMGDIYFNRFFHRIDKIDEVDQALIFIKNPISSTKLQLLLFPLINIPRVCVAINKFVIYTDVFENINEDYDIALSDYIKSIFKKRIAKYTKKNNYSTNIKFSRHDFGLTE